MAGVAVSQFVGFQVEHSDKGRDKHTRLVVLGQRAPHGFCYLVSRIDVVAAGNAEHSHRHGHIEGGRNTFSRHVAHDEAEFVVVEIIVVEIAAHFLGRQQRGMDVDVGTVGQRLMGLGHHAVLNIVGNAQLVLDTLVVGRCPGEFGNVMAERLLHVYERLAQLPHLVLHAQFGHLGMQVAPRYFAG